jgi:hypothetical protein
VKRATLIAGNNEVLSRDTENAVKALPEFAVDNFISACGESAKPSPNEKT